MRGPLAGSSLVEIAAIGPVPFAGMVMSDLGSEVVRLDRIGADRHEPPSPIERGRRSIAINLKAPAGREVALDIIRQADGLMEGFRPGVMESLGLGPADVLAVNPRAVYGRMTGWGQEGPLSAAAGHDINYIALSGVLGHIGQAGNPPDIPLNLVGDYGGGGMLLVIGMLAGLFESAKSGQGQVVDAAMVDGAAQLMAAACGMMARGQWTNERGNNLLDGGAPFYGVYETADHKYITVGPVERRFHKVLARLAGIPVESLDDRMERSRWPDTKARMVELFSSRTLEEWCKLLEGSDGCFAPVLTVSEAARHPHLVSRGTYFSEDGVVQPAPAPRFSRTPGHVRGRAPDIGEHTQEILESLGYDSERIRALAEAGIVGSSSAVTSERA
jgi:alpha-methylacyl-CoA racemase